MLKDDKLFRIRNEFCKSCKKLYITKKMFIQFEDTSNNINKPANIDLKIFLLHTNDAVLKQLIIYLTFNTAKYLDFINDRVDYKCLENKLEELLCQWYNVVPPH